MDERDQHGKRSSGKSLIIKIVVAIVAVITLFFLEENWRGGNSWDRFKRQWEAKGESLEYTHFVPSPVPDDQNFAMTPVVASSYSYIIDKNGHELQPHLTNFVNRLAMTVYRKDNRKTPTNGNWAQSTMTDLRAWQQYYRAAVQTNRELPVATNEFPVAPQEQSPAQDVLLALSGYDSAIEELRAAAKLPYSRFPLEYDKDDPADIFLPHLAALKSSSQTLQLRALAELQLGQSDKAGADTELIFHLIGASHNEPFLISHLVRVAMVNIALQPIYEGLAHHKWSDAQLVALDSELVKLDFLADYQRSMRSEAVYSARMLDYLQRTRKIADYWAMFGGGGPSGNQVIDYAFHLLPAGWFRQNKISFTEFYLRGCLPAADPQKREFLPHVARQAVTNFNQSMAHPNPGNLAMRTLLSPIRSWIGDQNTLVRKFAYAQESADLARVAIALERFRLAHGKYPDSLDQLKPQFMSDVPHDLIGGQPLNYCLTNSIFVLYSVGWNEKDDGGTPTTINSGLPNSDDGDWVWQYPSK
jgi:hypothetical protein